MMDKVCPGCGQSLEGTNMVLHIIKVYGIDYPPRGPTGCVDNMRRMLSWPIIRKKMAEHLRQQGGK